MNKMRATLFLSTEVLDSLARYARTHRLGSSSQAAEQLLRQALFCQADEYLEERVIPSIRDAIREEFAALHVAPDGHEWAHTTGLKLLEPVYDGRLTPESADRQPHSTAKAR